MLFVLIVVIAVASGLACLVFLIAAFCLLRQRMKDARDLEDELGSVEDRLSPVKRIRSKSKIQKHLTRIGTKWPTIPPVVCEPTNSTAVGARNPLDMSPKPPLSFFRPKYAVPASVSVTRVSTQTGRSETASIYSTESAPPHFHDQFSNPLFLRRVVMSNITRANLPKGMDLPSTITRDIGLFTRPLPQPGTANLPPNSDNIHPGGGASPEIPRSHLDPGTVKNSYALTTPITHFAALESNRLLYRGVNLQTLKKTASASSFPPPSW